MAKDGDLRVWWIPPMGAKKSGQINIILALIETIMDVLIILS